MSGLTEYLEGTVWDSEQKLAQALMVRFQYPYSKCLELAREYMEIVDEWSEFVKLFRSI